MAVVVDSIQTVHTEQLTSAPGSISQVQEVAGQLMWFAKRNNVPVFIIGHVTKEGGDHWAHACWNISSIRCCISRATKVIASAFCVR